MDPVAHRRAGRASWKVNVARSFAEADAYDLEFWLSVPPGERAALTWQLSWELHQLANPGQVHEPRLRRSVAHVSRR